MGMLDTKARILQGKINASKRPVTRAILIFPAEIVQDVLSNFRRWTKVQILQSPKDLTKQRNDLEGKVVENLNFCYDYR